MAVDAPAPLGDPLGVLQDGPDRLPLLAGKDRLPCRRVKLAVVLALAGQARAEEHRPQGDVAPGTAGRGQDLPPSPVEGDAAEAVPGEEPPGGLGDQLPLSSCLRLRHLLLARADGAERPVASGVTPAVLGPLQVL